MNHLAEQVETFEAGHEAREAKLTELRQVVAAVLEEVENNLELIEKKRKQITNQANRVAGLQNGQDQPPADPRQAARDAFRSQGYRV